MKNIGQNRRLAVYIAALTLLFIVGLFFHFPIAIAKVSILLLLMVIFYFDQQPVSLMIYGGLGIAYIAILGWLMTDLRTPTDYLLWGIEQGCYVGLYLIFWQFSRWLSRLYDTSKLHELVIAGTTAGLWQWGNMNSSEQWWSPRYYQLLGYENNEIPATLDNLRELIHPDDREIAFQSLQDYISGERKVLESEYRIRTKSGIYKWFLGSGEVQFEKDTRTPRRIVGSIIDIDQKKQYEISQNSQAALIAISSDAIITTDPDFNILTWSAGAERLYNIKSAYAIGKNIRSLLTTSYPYSTNEEVLHIFAEQDEWRGEAHQTTHKGQKVYVLSSVKMIRNDKGQTIGVLAINSDISLLRINNELTAALKMVESSTEYIEQLAYISSHDLRSPIVTLQGLMNHLVACKAIAPEHMPTFEMLRSIVENMKSTSVALTSILQLRKNLTSREFATDNISLALVVNDVQEMLKAQIVNTGAMINVDVEKGLHLKIHNSFMRSMLYNLVSNSIKFKQPGRNPVISITARMDNNNVCIVVSDNGSGINLTRYQNKLFTIFTRFHDDTEGNGIGLHAVKMIVDYYKGQIDVQSKEQEGTTITIKIPAESDVQNLATNYGRQSGV